MKTAYTYSDHGGSSRTGALAITGNNRHSRFVGWYYLMSVFSMLSLILALFPAGIAFAASGTNGVMISATHTLPRGAVFLADAVGGAAGGHWWVSDAVLGICRLDPQAGTPPFHLVNCNGTAKSGGNIVVGPAPASLGATVLPAGAKMVYVADDSSKSINVVRFIFNPATGNIGSPQIMQANNPTFVGGGSGGGRPVALALAPNGADLYVGYLKSGDILKITGAKTATTTTPPAAKVGTTSDGKGVNAFVLFKNDLYVAELGGLGLSMIADPSGLNRPVCSAAAVCRATTVSPTPSFFPGGLATDGTYIYIGDAPLASPDSILRYNPATSIVDTYSNTVPSYTSAFDGATRTAYFGPMGLGLAPNGDLYIGDDPTFSLATPPLQQGHIWLVPALAAAPAVTGIAPSSGSSLGGDVVTLTGTGFSPAPGATSVNFGANPAVNVVCAGATSCTATSTAGTGVVDVIVSVGGILSAASPADQFTYVTPPPANGVAVTAIAPASGVISGGTLVTITGTNLTNPAGPTSVNFGANAASSVTCASATSCTALSPAGAAGVVDIQVTVNGQTSAAAAADQFTYIAPVASLYAWGITAPKGGAVWLPGSLGGHWWSSDHSQGLCRLDPVPGTTLNAINFSICASDLVGSAGQAVYDPRVTADGITHYVYVPDNAVKSTAVWRLTFDPRTETLVPDPLDGVTMATAMTPLADVRTLKPNGMALGPDGNLYVSDLVEPNIRRVTNPNGDPRTQTITIVAVTGDNRGANGTQGFIGNLLYISGNRAAQFFDITQCPIAAGAAPCGMASVPAPSGVFVAGLAVDAPHKLLYLADSPGGANATINRYDASKDIYVAFPAGSVVPDAFGVVTCPSCTVGSSAVNFVTGGLLPALGTPNATVFCALTCQRPWDQINHPTAGIAAGQGIPSGFAFAFGLSVDANGNLAITEDPSAGARSGRGTMWTVPYIP
jgi:hypothetical protein